MAQVGYNGGVDDVQPDSRPPDDYQRIEANPSSFGGAIAQGAEKAGAGAVDLSKFWGKVQAQDASNNAEKEASDLLVHAKSLEGQDALDSQQSVLKSLDAIREKYRGGLNSPEAQSQYDGTVTPYFNRFIRGNLDTHFVDQGKVVANKVNTDSFTNAITMATTAGSDGSSDPASPTYWVKNAEVARAKAFMAAKADAVQRGLWNQPEVQAAVGQKANAAYMSAIEARALTKPDEAWDRLQDPKVKAQLGADYDKTFKSVQETVARAYISKADALAVNNPAGVEQFVRDNEAKFGEALAYGAALDKAHKAADRAVGKGGGNTSWDVVGPGGKASTTNVSSNAQVYGDSLGEGVKTAYGLSGDTKVGRTPQQVYDALHALPDGALAGKPVVISTGASNSPGNVEFARNQIREAVAKGADPSQITVLGVGDRPDFAGVNDKLKEIAGQFGSRFQPVDPSKLSPDRVHPVNYNGLLGGAAPARAPGAITTGPAANIDQSIPPEGRALLATIGGPEAGGQYNVRYGGAHFEGYGDHPRIAEKITTGPNAGKTSDAAGRYQFLGSTWNEAKAALGLTDFSPASQDKAAWWLAQRDYKAKTGGDLLADLKSGDPSKLAGAAQALHSTWTSLPGGVEEGMSGGRFAASYNAALQGKGASTIASREPASYSASPSTAPLSPDGFLDTTKPTDAAFTTPPPAALTPPAPPQTPEDVVNAIYDRQSAAMQHLQGMGLTPKQMIEGERQITQRAAFEIAAAGEQQRQIKAREDDATNDVLGTARKDGYTAAYQKLNAYMDDPKRPLSEKQFDALTSKLSADSGDPNPKWVGPGYSEAIHRILADRKDPNHIYDVRQLMELQDPKLTPQDKRITGRGYAELYSRLRDLTKSEDEVGYQETYKQGLNALERKLTEGGMDPLTGKPTDSLGLELFQTAGVAKYNTLYTAWRQAVKAGKADPTDFMSDPKKLEALANEIYPRQERPYLRMQHENTTLPEIPPRVDPKGWGEIYSMRPTNPDWGPAIAKLASDPAKQGPIWDAKGPGKVISAKDALAKMGIDYASPPPQRPHVPTPESAAETETNASEIPYATSGIDTKTADALQHFVTIGDMDLGKIVSPALRHDILAIKAKAASVKKDLEDLERARPTGPKPFPPIYAPPPRVTD